MKKLALPIFLSLFFINTLKSQEKIELVDFIDYSFEIPDSCIYEPCLLSAVYQSDTFAINVLTPLSCQKSLGYIKMIKDTLLLFRSTQFDYIETDTIIKFDEEKNKLDTVLYSTFGNFFSGPTNCLGLYTYKIKGLSEKPKIIRFNNIKMQDCHLPESTFTIYQGDTINITDKFGLREGVWMDFFDNGTIKRKYSYNNGFIEKGYEFGLNGDTISIESNYGRSYKIIFND